MIERKIVDAKLQEYLVEEYIRETMSRVGHSHTELQKTPLGEKIIIHASRPGLIVGAKGSNIKKLTKVLKTKFKLENPQIEIVEIKNIYTTPQLIAENIAFQMEKFGSQRFKGIGYGAIENAKRNGAMGIEILITGKLPSSRARRWRFYMGYLKKSGEIATSGVKVAYTQAKLKTGVVGIQVRVMPSDLILPDKVKFVTEVVEEDTKENVTEEAKKEAKELAPEVKKAEEEKKAEDAKAVDESKGAKPVKKTTKKTTKKSAKKEPAKDESEAEKTEDKK